jgi:hypothetical protein
MTHAPEHVRLIHDPLILALIIISVGSVSLRPNGNFGE